MKLFLFAAALALAAANASSGDDDDCSGLLLSSSSDGGGSTVEVSDAVKLSVNDGERAFAVNVLKAIFKEFEEDDERKGRISRNVFISPHSIYQVKEAIFCSSATDTNKITFD